MLALSVYDQPLLKYNVVQNRKAPIDRRMTLNIYISNAPYMHQVPQRPKFYSVYLYKPFSR